jgi:nicotinamidase-related amidase
MPHATRLDPATSAMLVVDVQEKLMAKIPDADDIVRNIAFVLDAAPLLGVEVCATEQYPKGLGPTVAELARRLPERPDKLTFSCCGVPGLVESLRRHGRKQVHLAVDALGSRYAIDRETALRRLEGAGAVPTTVETAVFEWTGGAAHPNFKAISALVRVRTV